MERTWVVVIDQKTWEPVCCFPDGRGLLAPRRPCYASHAVLARTPEEAIKKAREVHRACYGG